MTSHPLLHGSLTNRQAALLSLLVCAFTIGAGAVRAFATNSEPNLPAIALGVAFYIPLAINAWIDARAHVLLKNWTHLAGAVWIFGLVVGPEPIVSLISASVAAAMFVSASKLSRGRLIGMGDARLLVVLAGWNGLWWAWGALSMLVFAFGAHGLYVIARIMTMRATLRTRHPLGPWLVAGSWVAWALTA